MSKELLEKITDRSKNLDEVIEEVKNWWGFDLFSRKPSPAMKNGIHEGTDLDLACFLYNLAQRSAEINIPYYKSLRPKSLTEGKMVTSKENRHGKVIGLTSNKDVFTFSIKIFDENVVNADMTKGDFRTFSITSPSGKMYDGWGSIEWKPDAEEMNFLNKHALLVNNQVTFENFVHPNRWTSFYGKKYVITKALIDRLTDEAKIMNKQIKTMLADGIIYPETGHGSKKVYGKTLKEDGKSVKFESLDVEVDVPEYKNEYLKYVSSQENLIYLTEKRKSWVYTIIPILRFATRCTELSFFKHGSGKLPVWIKKQKCEWEEGFKLPRKKIIWDKMDIKFVDFDHIISIRKRIKSKSEIMCKTFKE